jgi:hypothetical protein
MGYHAASSDNFLPTFRDNLSVRPQGSSSSLKPEDGTGSKRRQEIATTCCVMTEKSALITFMYILLMFCCTKISILWVKVLRKTNTPPHTYIDKHEVFIYACNANVFVVFNVGVYIIGCVSIVCGFIVIWHSRQVVLYTLHKTWFIYLLIAALGAFLKPRTGHISVCPSTSAPKLSGRPAFYRIILIIFYICLF